jgi:putative restriction endonuclease
MAKGILLSKANSGYDDVRFERYHFPKVYLSRIREMVGDTIIYYEPGKGGGSACYVAVARIVQIDLDPAKSDHYYARVSDYLEFDHPVPLRRGDKSPYESSLRTDGGQLSGYVQSAARIITDGDFDAIFLAGFGQLLTDQRQNTRPGFEDTQAPFVRPIIEQLIAKPFREAAFASRVKRAYDATCAFTGLNMRNGGGRSEVEAAHIRPVGDGHSGPDSVRNGLALSRTVHWMFDRGILSVDSDHRILKAKGLVPEPVLRLLNPSGEILAPGSERERPHRAFLEYHRNRIFKDARV